jgi:hypothetical protein
MHTRSEVNVDAQYVRLLVAGCLKRRPSFAAKSMYVEFVVGKLTRKPVFSETFFSPCQYHFIAVPFSFILSGRRTTGQIHRQSHPIVTVVKIDNPQTSTFPRNPYLTISHIYSILLFLWLMHTLESLMMLILIWKVGYLLCSAFINVVIVQSEKCQQRVSEKCSQRVILNLRCNKRFL